MIKFLSQWRLALAFAAFVLKFGGRLLRAVGRISTCSAATLAAFEINLLYPSGGTALAMVIYNCDGTALATFEFKVQTITIVMGRRWRKLRNDTVCSTATMVAS